jgi:hypothetical protein
MHLIKPPSVFILLAAALLSGCATTTSQDARSLQTAMEVNHQATIAILQAVNQEMLPLRIRNSLGNTSFTKADLVLIAPADIAAWDQILGGLETYCSALARLTSGQSSADFAAAAEGLAGEVRSFGAAVKLNSQPGAAGVGASVIEIGTLLLQHKAAAEAREIARAADSRFQFIIKDLIEALGYSGDPPQSGNHGVLPTYSLAYRVATEENRAVTFKDEAIAGFGAMDREKKLAAIQSFTEWLATEQEHDRFLASMESLVAALQKTAQTHAALAHGSSEDLAKQLAELQIHVRSTAAIYQQLKRGG